MLDIDYLITQDINHLINELSQQWLGHASFQTTLSIYSHTEHDFKNNISEQLSRVLNRDD